MNLQELKLQLSCVLTFFEQPVRFKELLLENSVFDPKNFQTLLHVTTLLFALFATQSGTFTILE